MAQAARALAIKGCSLIPIKSAESREIPATSLGTPWLVKSPVVLAPHEYFPPNLYICAFVAPRNEVYEKYADLCVESPPVLRFAI